MKVITAQYKVDQLANWSAYCEKIERLVRLAKQDDGHLLMFAEYAGLELASWHDGTLHQQCEAIQDMLPDYLSFYQSLAAKYQIYLQPGTLPVRDDQGFFRNRAYLFGINKTIDFQDKLNLIPEERQLGFIKPGTELKLFNTAFGKVGINICYDSEFPLLAQQLTTAGAQLILVPSCTSSLHGYTRVSISCRARAIENQCYVVQSSLVGTAPWCDLISENTGQSAVYTPPDIDFPPQGILAHGTLDLEQLVAAEIDFAKINIVRTHGQVANFNDLQQQANAAYSIATVSVA